MVLLEVNHLVYLAHVATVTWRVCVCYCLANSYDIISDITNVSTIILVTTETAGTYNNLVQEWIEEIGNATI